MKCKSTTLLFAVLIWFQQIHASLEAPVKVAQPSVPTRESRKRADVGPKDELVRRADDEQLVFAAPFPASTPLAKVLIRTTRYCQRSFHLLSRPTSSVPTVRFHIDGFADSNARQQLQGISEAVTFLLERYETAAQMARRVQFTEMIKQTCTQNAEWPPHELMSPDPHKGSDVALLLKKVRLRQMTWTDFCNLSQDDYTETSGTIGYNGKFSKTSFDEAGVKYSESGRKTGVKFDRGHSTSDLTETRLVAEETKNEEKHPTLRKRMQYSRDDFLSIKETCAENVDWPYFDDWVPGIHLDSAGGGLPPQNKKKRGFHHTQTWASFCAPFKGKYPSDGTVHWTNSTMNMTQHKDPLAQYNSNNSPSIFTDPLDPKNKDENKHKTSPNIGFPWSSTKKPPGGYQYEEHSPSDLSEGNRVYEESHNGQLPPLGSQKPKNFSTQVLARRQVSTVTNPDILLCQSYTGWPGDPNTQPIAHLDSTSGWKPPNVKRTQHKESFKAFCDQVYKNSDQNQYGWTPTNHKSNTDDNNNMNCGLNCKPKDHTFYFDGILFHGDPIIYPKNAYVGGGPTGSKITSTPPLQSKRGSLQADPRGEYSLPRLSKRVTNNLTGLQKMCLEYTDWPDRTEPSFALPDSASGMQPPKHKRQHKITWKQNCDLAFGESTTPLPKMNNTKNKTMPDPFNFNVDPLKQYNNGKPPTLPTDPFFTKNKDKNKDGIWTDQNGYVHTPLGIAGYVEHSPSDRSEGQRVYEEAHNGNLPPVQKKGPHKDGSSWGPEKRRDGLEPESRAQPDNAKPNIFGKDVGVHNIELTIRAESTGGDVLARKGATLAKRAPPKLDSWVRFDRKIVKRAPDRPEKRSHEAARWTFDEISTSLFDHFTKKRHTSTSLATVEKHKTVTRDKTKPVNDTTATDTTRHSNWRGVVNEQHRFDEPGRRAFFDISVLWSRFGLTKRTFTLKRFEKSLGSACARCTFLRRSPDVFSKGERLRVRSPSPKQEYNGESHPPKFAVNLSLLNQTNTTQMHDTTEPKDQTSTYDLYNPFKWWSNMNYDDDKTKNKGKPETGFRDWFGSTGKNSDLTPDPFKAKPGTTDRPFVPTMIYPKYAYNIGLAAKVDEPPESGHVV